MDQCSGLSQAGREIESLLEVGAIGHLTDGQLLDRFIARREETVFRAILMRHGAMVWGVCRRILGNHHDAEDAFQATCLVLARKAASVFPREKLGPWLHGVATRTAIKARQNRSKRESSELVEECESAVTDENAFADLRAALDRALNRLPEKYRVPIVLCELEGKSHREAAETLGWPIGTVSGRLSRGKSLLADRLTRSGVTLSVGSLAAVLSSDARASMPSRLIEATVHAGCFVLSAADEAGVVTGTVLGLTEEVTRAMMVTKLKMLVATVGTGLVLVVGGVGVVRSVRSQEPAEVKKTQAGLEVTREVQQKQVGKTVEVRQPEAFFRSQVGKGQSTDPFGHPDLSASGRGFSPPTKTRRTFGGGPDEPLYTQEGYLVFVTPPKKDSFTVFNIMTGTSSTIEIPKEYGPAHDIGWWKTGEILVLAVSAPKVTRLDVFSFARSKWYSQDLKTPATTRPEPTVANNMVAYRLGRTIYAFSSQSQKWATLDLPEDLKGDLTVTDNGVTFEGGGYIYSFTPWTEKFKETDLRKVIKEAIEAEKKAKK